MLQCAHLHADERHIVNGCKALDGIFALVHLHITLQVTNTCACGVCACTTGHKRYQSQAKQPNTAAQRKRSHYCNFNRA